MGIRGPRESRSSPQSNPQALAPSPSDSPRRRPQPALRLRGNAANEIHYMVRLMQQHVGHRIRACSRHRDGGPGTILAIQSLFFGRQKGRERLIQNARAQSHVIKPRLSNRRSQACPFPWNPSTNASERSLFSSTRLFNSGNDASTASTFARSRAVSTCGRTSSIPACLNSSTATGDGAPTRAINDSIPAATPCVRSGCAGARCAPPADGINTMTKTAINVRTRGPRPCPKQAPESKF